MVTGLLKRVVATWLVEPAVLSASLPTRGKVNYFCHWALRHRDMRPSPSHPLYDLCQIPEWDSTYAFSRSSLLWMWAFIHKSSPRCIVEMGSGRSTAMFARYVSESPSERQLISIDHDQEWLQRTLALLESLNLASYAKLMHCPAETTEISGHKDRNYRNVAEVVGAETPSSGIDLLLIDGPSGANGRRETLPSISGLLSSQATIFLDDCDRSLEKKTLNAWKDSFPSTVSLRGVLPLTGGLGWLDWSDSGSSNRLSSCLADRVGC